jgi:hypothetical protein
MFRVLLTATMVWMFSTGTASAFFTYEAGSSGGEPTPVQESPSTPATPPAPVERLEMVPFSKGLPEAAPVQEQPVTDVVPLPAVPPATLQDPVTHVGVGVFGAVHSKGSGLPFRTAIPLIIPKGWKADFGDELLPHRLVSWGEGTSWGEVLRQICREIGAVAEIRWSEKRVRLWVQAPSLRPVALPESLPAPQAAPAEVADALNSITPPAAPSLPPLPIEPARPTWRIEPGSLKGQLEAWAQDAGYQVVWHSRNDWQVQAGASITGTLEDAVRVVVESLHRGGAPLRACIYTGNRVVEIRED